MSAEPTARHDDFLQFCAGVRRLTGYERATRLSYLMLGSMPDAELMAAADSGELDSAEIYAFTAAYVDLAARKTFGMLQHPVYSSAANSGLATARAAPEAPQ